VLVVEAGVEAGAEGVEDDSLVVAAASFGVGVGRGTGIIIRLYKNGGWDGNRKKGWNGTFEFVKN
jgi:hypothetical protein